MLFRAGEKICGYLNDHGSYCELMSLSHPQDLISEFFRDEESENTVPDELPVVVNDESEQLSHM
jgi:hypothetical protein